MDLWSHSRLSANWPRSVLTASQSFGSPIAGRQVILDALGDIGRLVNHRAAVDNVDQTRRQSRFVLADLVPQCQRPQMDDTRFPHASREVANLRHIIRTEQTEHPDLPREGFRAVFPVMLVYLPKIR
jgi:hypothetical protein